MPDKRKKPEVSAESEKRGGITYNPNGPEKEIASTLSEKKLEELKQELKAVEEEFNSIFPIIIGSGAGDGKQTISVHASKDGELVLIKKFTGSYEDDIYEKYKERKKGNDKKVFELKERMKKLREKIKKLEELKKELKAVEEELYSIFPIIIGSGAGDGKQTISIHASKDGELVLIKEFTGSYEDDIYERYHEWEKSNNKRIFKLKERMKKLREIIKKLEEAKGK